MDISHIKKKIINEKYKWRLEDIYTNDDEWEKSFHIVNDKLKDFMKYKNNFTNTSTNMLSGLNAYSELMQLANKLYSYAKMKSDMDITDVKYSENIQRALELLGKISADTTFLLLEVSTISVEKFDIFIKENNDLSIYSKFVNDIMRQKVHTINKREEVLLSMTYDISNYSLDVFNTLNSEIEFPEVEDENGDYLKLTGSNYLTFISSNDGQVRMDAYEALHNAYKMHKNTFASLMIGNIKKNIFYVKVRNFNSSLEGSLYYDNIELSVYDSLISATNSRLNVFDKYFELRRSILKIHNLHFYDIYMPLIKQPEVNIKYEAAMQMIEESLKVCGEEYVSNLRQGFSSGWIDVYGCNNKALTEYSIGTHDIHPYILLNYTGSIKDMLTLTYEMGNALHLHYTSNTQPYIYSNTKIFTHVPSIVNKLLLLDYLINSSDDVNLKKYLLIYYIERFRAVIYQHVMFAEFEKAVHEKAEDEETISIDALFHIYEGLIKKYYRENVTYSDLTKYEFLKAPHFYTSFSVYKYCIEFLTASAIAKDLLEQKNDFTAKYIEFLKTGDSVYPIEVFKKAGINIDTTVPYEKAFDYFQKYLQQLEKII